MPCYSRTFFINNKEIEEELDFYKSNYISAQILKVEKDYYIFKGGVNGTDADAVTDTMWFKKRR